MMDNNDNDTTPHGTSVQQKQVFGHFPVSEIKKKPYEILKIELKIKPTGRTSKKKMEQSDTDMGFEPNKRHRSTQASDAPHAPTPLRIPWDVMARLSRWDGGHSLGMVNRQWRDVVRTTRNRFTYEVTKDTVDLIIGEFQFPWRFMKEAALAVHLIMPNSPPEVREKMGLLYQRLEEAGNPQVWNPGGGVRSVEITVREEDMVESNNPDTWSGNRSAEYSRLLLKNVLVNLNTLRYLTDVKLDFRGLGLELPGFEECWFPRQLQTLSLDLSDNNI
jgi:hypothetical protein